VDTDRVPPHPARGIEEIVPTREVSSHSLRPHDLRTTVRRGSIVHSSRLRTDVKSDFHVRGMNETPEGVYCADEIP
jgi:hypothetical protein